MLNTIKELRIENVLYSSTKLLFIYYKLEPQLLEKPLVLSRFVPVKKKKYCKFILFNMAFLRLTFKNKTFHYSTPHKEKVKIYVIKVVKINFIADNFKTPHFIVYLKVL